MAKSNLYEIFFNQSFFNCILVVQIVDTAYLDLLLKMKFSTLSHFRFILTARHCADTLSDCGKTCKVKLRLEEDPKISSKTTSPFSG